MKNAHILPAPGRLAATAMTLAALNLPAWACGPYSPEKPGTLNIFRTCQECPKTQWDTGVLAKDDRVQQNCLLWQSITAADIPLADIRAVVYKATLADLAGIGGKKFAGNRFAQWLAQPAHKEDLDYLLVAKETEELRAYMQDPWYYGYEGDPQHRRLAQLADTCRAYTGTRHAARYALQDARLCFAAGRHGDCTGIWRRVGKMPRNVVTDMTAGYVAGAYLRLGNRAKAIEIYERSGDIKSLVELEVWQWREVKSRYKDNRVKALEYVFERQPDCPLLAAELQRQVRDLDFEFARGCEDDSVKNFCAELKSFAARAAASPRCTQKGMWRYAAAFLNWLEGDTARALTWLAQAEQSDNTPLLAQSIRAMRFMTNALMAGKAAYPAILLRDLQWLDAHLANDMHPDPNEYWQSDNATNRAAGYWQDVTRRVLLGEVCPRLQKAGDNTVALHCANYAANRAMQLHPQIIAWSNEEGTYDNRLMDIDRYRRDKNIFNGFDFSNQFFACIDTTGAGGAASYARRLMQPQTALDRFFKDRCYADSDYICDIVGTLYLREMDYESAAQWLARVSPGYQSRTNVAREGYFDRNPFNFQHDKKHAVSKKGDYKLRFALAMIRLNRLMGEGVEANRRAWAMIRYATGLRNSFGHCWYLTAYEAHVDYRKDGDSFKTFEVCDRGSFAGNAHAQKAYAEVDRLMAQALTLFTDPEMAARAHLAMLNHATVMKKYAGTRAARRLRGRCDTYCDYALQKR